MFIVTSSLVTCVFVVHCIVPFKLGDNSFSDHLTIHEITFNKMFLQDTLLLSLHNFLSLVFSRLSPPKLAEFQSTSTKLKRLKEENDVLRQTLIKQRQQNAANSTDGWEALLFISFCWIFMPKIIPRTVVRLSCLSHSCTKADPTLYFEAIFLS